MSNGIRRIFRELTGAGLMRPNVPPQPPAAPAAPPPLGRPASQRPAQFEEIGLDIPAFLRWQSNSDFDVPLKEDLREDDHEYGRISISAHRARDVFYGRMPAVNTVSGRNFNDAFDVDLGDVKGAYDPVTIDPRAALAILYSNTTKTRN